MVVFRLTDKLNNKIYIGIDTKNSPDYFGSDIHIKHLIKTYGTVNFKKEILYESDNIDEIKEKESYYIKKLDSTNPDIGYNVFSTIKNKLDKNFKLTSVEVNLELFNKFKMKSIEKNITFKEVVNTAIQYVLNNRFISGSFI